MALYEAASEGGSRALSFSRLKTFTGSSPTARTGFAVANNAFTKQKHRFFQLF
jgi:hypothetical protein